EFGNITVKVVVGDITADMSGAIINGATSHFNLSKGVLSSAILKRAGLEMQKQCDTNPKFVHPRVNPYIKVTKGFNLLCDYVVHMVTPSTAAELGTRLKNALDVADLMKVKSVAVPTLGAGAYVFIVSLRFYLVWLFLFRKLTKYRKIGAVHMVTVFGHSLKVKNGKCELSGIKGRLEHNHGLPSQWKDMGGDRWKKVELPHHTVEFQNIFKLFHKSSPVATIRKIERIQNPKLYKHYELNKSDVKEHMKSAEPVERELFHGTSQQDAEKICGDGFDRNFAGKNATMYGKGSYFAVNSSYSVNYARNSGSSTCCVFLANVITGDFCQGNQYMKAPDVKPGSNGRLYDSAVDSLSNPSIFIAFRDANVYPTYLITFI
uniref:Poly [ADP-ribose] polymerase n=1 Tax=Ciona savignyi TaxID=51511 RepID=H2ZC15_CIOSA